ncbi:hypothetical protein FB45DRAFT_405216 [Roridomyces roridus]|uniref:Uncharacterized protein n=1 Tax=Roridomyces roridus TaxID=1738132 RepID=A0AAD7FUR8_9AGAR|nr:hypothetical protein FB45DRAFT_405216 [Roridomyces roridus]
MSRVPLIVRAQQMYPQDEVLDPVDGGTPARRELSTISERTEHTEIVSPRSPNWPIRRQLRSLTVPRPVSSVPTSYGQAVDDPQVDSVRHSIDPDLIPVSPSDSAVHRLSLYEPPPSLPPSESDSYDSNPTPRAPSEPLPPLDTIPDIPDMTSKSNSHIQSKSASASAKKSKLAMLAASRASTTSARSESSRSTGLDVTGSVKTFSGSVKTYPNLRPASQSLRAPGSVVSTETISSTSSHVRRAIQTALDLEAEDHSPVAQTSATEASQTPTPTFHRPSAPTPSKVPVMPSSSSSSPARQPSKLALLAQANKAARTAKPPQTTPLSGPPPLPEEHTEYLTPIANGSTVTTAITTSYQSLYSLTNPAPPLKSTAPYVVPLPASMSGDAKKSKLAMKIKKAQEKQVPQPVVPAAPPPAVPSMFLPKPSRTRASPSAFASLLVDDASPSDSSDTETREVEKQKQLKEKLAHKQRRSKRHPAPVPHLFTPSGFKFDDPSPDDIVLNARRDTSLAHTKKSPHSAFTTKPFTSKI